MFSASTLFFDRGFSILVEVRRYTWRGRAINGQKMNVSESRELKNMDAHFDSRADYFLHTVYAPRTIFGGRYGT